MLDSLIKIIYICKKTIFTIVKVVFFVVKNLDDHFFLNVLINNYGKFQNFTNFAKIVIR